PCSRFPARSAPWSAHPLPMSAASRASAKRWPRRSSSISRRWRRTSPCSTRSVPCAREKLLERRGQRFEQHLSPLAPHVAVLDAIRSLRAPNAFAVISGQQPGLFASPLYSLYKALQTIALARELTAQWGTPVIALFWNHADDHDVAEVHHAHFVNANLDVQRVGLAGLASGKIPLSRILLDDERHRS